MPRWISVVLFPCIASVALAPGNSAAAAETNRPPVLLLPPLALVYEVGVTRASKHLAWSGVAQENLSEGLPVVAAHVLGRPVLATPPLATGELERVREVHLLAWDVVHSAGAVPGFRKTAQERLAHMQPTVGTTLAFLADRTGLEEAVGVVAYQGEQSSGSVATQAALAAGMLLESLIALPEITGVQMLGYTVHLRTGEVRWYAMHRASEVAGINSADLRRRESAEKLLGRALQDWPQAAGRVREDNPVRIDPAEAGHRAYSAWEGYFSVRPPAGWRSTAAAKSVSATSDGRLLNEFRVQLRHHSVAFASSDQDTTRTSTPTQLLGWFLEDTQEQHGLELRVVAASAEATLAGQPAFRVRYIFRRSPDAPLSESVVIGTVTPDGLLLASLTAPHLGYFDRSLAAFEAATATIELRQAR